MIYRVKQLSLDGKTPVALPNASAVEVEVYHPDENPPLGCRICLGDTQTPENPLISPCSCSGTMKFVHIDCLREWLQSRLNVKQNGSAMSYFWHNLDCELCKVDFPTAVEVAGEVKELVEVRKPEAAFMVLEENKRDTSRGLHVVSLTEGSCFRIGRGHDSDIRVADISVSRLHAVIKLTQGEFYLEDKNSKFGTLVQVRQPLVLTLGLSVSVQVSRSVVTLKVKRPWGLLQCCNCFPQTNRVMDYPESTVQVSPHMEDQGEDDVCQPHEVTEQVREVTEVRDFPAVPKPVEEDKGRLGSHHRSSSNT